MKKPQNAKAAAQRLAQMMAHQSPDDDEKDDDLLYDFDAPGVGLAGSRPARNPSPLSVRKATPQQSDNRSNLGPARASPVVTPLDQQPVSVRNLNLVEQKPTPARNQNPVEPQPLSARSRNPLEQQPLSARTRPLASKPLMSLQSDSPPEAIAVEKEPLHSRSSFSRPCINPRSSQLIESDEESQPLSSHSVAPAEISSSARLSSLGRPSLRIKTVAMAPSGAGPTVKPFPSGTPSEIQMDKSIKYKRSSLDFGTFKFKDPPISQQSSSALQDELDMLQEENDSLLEKLRLAEERCEEAESRAGQLEKQIASLGEGVSLEARLLSRKEADLQKREAALKVAAETYGGSSEEIAALRAEAEAAREEAMASLEQLHGVEREVRSLRIVTKRMILTKEEMEEVVLKRSWLARCWGLCVRYGILGEIAFARNEYWSALASHPVDVILAAGRKAKDENLWMNTDLDERDDSLKDMEETSRKPNVESMLLVEKGLRELTSLKVEAAIALAMAQTRRPVVLKSSVSDELKLPGEGSGLTEVFELTPDESEDVLLKQAWLTYFWRRAKLQDLEPDITDERLQFWIHHGNRPPTSLDAIDVERGLVELHKLGVETKLWEECRKQIDPDSGDNTLAEMEYQMLS